MRLPLLDADFGVGFAEHRLTQASYATVAVAAALKVRDAEIVAAHLGLANAADRPSRAREAEEFLTGRRVSPETFAQAGRLAAELDASPRSEPHADAEYKRYESIRNKTSRSHSRKSSLDLKLKYCYVYIVLSLH